MITIKQETELPFHHVDVKDAVIMAELMNQLNKCIAIEKARTIRNKFPDDKKQLYNQIYSDAIYIKPDEVEKIFNILSTIGFVTTEEYFVDDILTEHLKKD